MIGGRSSRLAHAAVAATCAIPLLWPGDIPFINDEPQLIANALHANAGGRLASMGLLGTYGFSYGPAPTWVYQALLGISRDLVLVTVLHALLVTTVTAAALWWLARSLRLWIWFVPVPLLSPYFWFYARVLWDNTFLLPLGALAIAGYAAFLATSSSAGLRVAWASMVLIPLVHLMGLALIVPLGLHMLLVHGRALWSHRWSLTATLAGVLGLAWPYWMYLVSPRAPSPPSDQVVDGWIFPLLGGRLLSADGLDYFYGPDPVSGALFTWTAHVSSIAYGLVWAGLALALFAAVRAALSQTWTARAHVLVIVLGAIACQSAIDGVSGRFQHPHYQNGTWIAFVLLAWQSIDVLASRRDATRWGAIVATGTLASALALTVAGLMTGLRLSGGTREVYGPTLANQLRVARALSAYDESSPLQVQIHMWQRFPHTPAILRELSRRRQVHLPRRDLAVRYASADRESGVIELVER